MKLSMEQLERVRAVYKIGKLAIDKNVNNYLIGKDKIVKKMDYEFCIEEHSKVSKTFKSNKFLFGYCSYKDYKIVLHLDHVLYSSIDDIIDTLLHEAAHAVAYHIFGESGHGKYFRKVSVMFGNSPRATSKQTSPEIAAKYTKKEKYKIIFLDDRNLEVSGVYQCSRKLKDLHDRGMKNKKETIGRLWMVKMEDYKRIGLDFQKLAEVSFR